MANLKALRLKAMRNFDQKLQKTPIKTFKKVTQMTLYFRIVKRNNYSIKRMI